MEITYQLKRFIDLTNRELYQILKLRQEVFVVEQQCIYVDNDGLDLGAFHLSGYLTHQLVAYTRMIPPGVLYENHISIGRVITSQEIRSSGIGRDLMKRSIDLSRTLWPERAIMISAQSYLKEFYQSFGFIQSGEEYMEDGIPHFHMILDQIS